MRTGSGCVEPGCWNVRSAWRSPHLRPLSRIHDPRSPAVPGRPVPRRHGGCPDRPRGGVPRPLPCGRPGVRVPRPPRLPGACPGGPGASAGARWRHLCPRVGLCPDGRRHGGNPDAATLRGPGLLRRPQRGLGLRPAAGQGRVLRGGEPSGTESPAQGRERRGIRDAGARAPHRGNRPRPAERRLLPEQRAPGAHLQGVRRNGLRVRRPAGGTLGAVGSPGRHEAKSSLGRRCRAASVVRLLARGQRPQRHRAIRPRDREGGGPLRCPVGWRHAYDRRPDPDPCRRRLRHRQPRPDSLAASGEG
jgi:hypothetical protein